VHAHVARVDVGGAVAVGLQEVAHAADVDQLVLVRFLESI
jgi:hypothetical protein